MSLTARQIIGKTPRSRRDAAYYAVIKEVKISNRPGRIYIRAKVRTTHTNVGGTKKPPAPFDYVVTVALDDKGKVIISCSCDDFMYFWEYALYVKGAAKIEYSNGDPPVDKNPLLVPGCCKHAFALMTRLIEKGKL